MFAHYWGTVKPIDSPSTSPPAAAPDPADPRVMSGAIWSDLLAALDRSRQIVLGEGVPATPRDRAEGFRYLLRFLAAGNVLCVEHADPDYPEFGRMVDHTMPWGLDAPDCLYLFAPIRGDAAYRVHGFRGTANHIDVQANFGHFALGEISQWGTISSLNGFELDVDSDGQVEIWLGPEPAPTPRPRNWMKLEPGARFLLIRQYFNDWENERPADLLIERVGAAYPAPPPRSDQIAERLDLLRTWIEKGGTLWERMSRMLVEAMPPNTLNVFLPRPEEAGAGMKGQAYGMGNFHCASDEAVILSFTPPRCHHWSVSLANWWWESLDFATRQSSLNGHQARLDEDGVFRGVIAHSDPGVPNWIDTAGYTRGSLAVRFLLAESAPEVTLRVVPLAGVRRHLPGQTPVVDAATRAAILERRRHAVWRRYRR